MEKRDQRTIGLLFTGNRKKGTVRRSMSVLSSGTSIFYDNLIAEEAKEWVRKKQVEKKKMSMDGKKEKIKEELNLKKKEEEETKCSIVKLNPKLARVFWAESEPVIKSGILDKITTYERTLQEAKFEIVTTEVTYLNSLNELVTVFLRNKELAKLCSPEEWECLFNNIIVVKAASELVLSDLLQHWQEDVMLSNIYTVLRQHAISILRVYKEYCRMQPRSQQLLAKLKENNEWRTTLEKIESESTPNNTLQSYLLLPMQRVTRLPLLLDVVASKLQEGTNEFTACKLATSALQKLARDCDKSVGADDENPILELINKSKFKDNNNSNARPGSWTSTSSWEV